MIIDAELIGLLGYSGYIAIIAAIAYDKLKPKSVDGVQIQDITSSIIEAKDTFNEFLGIIEKVIDDKDINDSQTVALIKEAIQVRKKV